MTGSPFFTIPVSSAFFRACRVISSEEHFSSPLIAVTPQLSAKRPQTLSEVTTAITGQLDGTQPLSERPFPFCSLR